MKPGFLFLTAPALLAAAPPARVQVAIPRLAQAPSMGRVADLSSWKGAARITDFGMVMPDDQGENRWPTVAHVAWGPDALYVAFEASDPDPAAVRSGLHRRDDFNGDLDFCGVDVDASGKGQSSLRLLATPLGGQFDAIVTDASGENYTYDCLWQSVGVLTPTGYVVKLRVPYSSLRRQPGDWGLRFLRIIPRERRYGIGWPRMSKDIQCDLCQMAQVSGAPVDKPGSPLMLIPFATIQRTQSTGTDPLAGPQDTRQLGLDLRYAGTAVTLEGTYRPDFATADADVDPFQINSRFQVWYPERRPFFLEGMELLGVTGAQRQFFSRSVREPLYGLKASGQAAWASWTVLHGKDLGGGALLASLGAVGTEGEATRDTALAARFSLDDRGSGVSVIGTDKRLLGGVEAGGRSAGLYVDQVLGTAFRLTASGMSATSDLPEAGGAAVSRRGSATALGLEWNARNGWASLSTQATSPDLLLVSGFTDLRGYRRHAASVGWKASWNQGALSQANVGLRAQELQWWNGDPLDRTFGLDAYLETAGRWGFSLNADLAGRAFADDGSSVATRRFNAAVSWRRLSWAQLMVRGVVGRTLDLGSGAPATFRSASFSSQGSVAALTYSLSAQQVLLDRESDGLRLIRARQVEATATWQLPRHFYLRGQAFLVRYDGREANTKDRFVKVYAGWQPNAFTQAYLGWSGRRTFDPLAAIAPERMTERGLFAKVAYAVQF
jgi:hypothetical protein